MDGLRVPQGPAQQHRSGARRPVRRALGDHAVHGGTGDLGTPELTLIKLVYVVGLTWIWVAPLVRHLVRPRGPSQETDVNRSATTES